MTRLVDVEAGFRALTLGDDDTPAWNDVAVDRQRLYRSLVRNNLMGVLRRACPHARRIAGEAAFDVLMSAFLARTPIQTRLTRDIPGEFTGWLMSSTPAIGGSGIDAVGFAELCHFEALEIEVTLAETSPAQRGPLTDAAHIAMDTSARLAVYRHPVHTVTSSSMTLPAPTPTPAVLLCFQRAEAFVVEPIAAGVGKVLMWSAGGATVGDALAALQAEGHAQGVDVDVRRIRSALVGLQRLGAIAGFVPAT